MSGWEINFKESRQVWDAFVLTSPQRNIFVFSKFLDSLQVNYDLVTCYEKNKIVVGTVLIFASDGKPIDKPFHFTQYQGLLLADNANQAVHSQITHEFKVVEYFIRQLTEYYRNFCLCQSWRLNDLRPFQWHNYHQPDKGRFEIDLRYTGILDMKNYDDFEGYLSSIRLCRKAEFKKAVQRLKFEFSQDEAILDVLHAKTFERQKIARSNQDSLRVKAICQHAMKEGYGEMSIALLDDVPVSAVLFLYDDRTAFYLFGANDPGYRSTGAGSFLMLQMIRDAFEKGIEEIDFVGVNSPSRGDYKISFNAELKSYFVTAIMCP